MRIISGSLKGRSILVPKNFKGRPTTDFAREGLFNVLNHLVEFDSMAILDLFAGTGAFGIECLSRGADSVLCVEKQPHHIKFISDNFNHFGLKNGRALKMDVFTFLLKETTKYDLIFADPPYDLNRLMELPNIIFERGLLYEEGIFILEHPRDFKFHEHPHFFQEKKYSNVHFSFFHLSPKAEPSE